MSTKVREHKGSLEASMATVWTVRDRGKLYEIIRAQLVEHGFDVRPDMITVTPYLASEDPRTHWSATYVISVAGYGVWGMANGPLEDWEAPSDELWPEVPAMYSDCQTTEERFKHRIRRAAEKAIDRCAFHPNEVALIVWEKIQVALPGGGGN